MSAPKAGVTIEARQCSPSVTVLMGAEGFPTFGSIVGYVESNAVSATAYATYNDSLAQDCYGNLSGMGEKIGLF